MNDFTIHPSWNNYATSLVLSACLMFSAVYTKVSVPSEVAPDYVPFALAGASILLFIIVALKRNSQRYELRNGRLICSSGLIARNESSVRLSDVRSVHLSQTMSERLMNTGDLSFASSAQSDSEVTFKGIDDPKKLSRQLQEFLKF